MLHNEEGNRHIERRFRQWKTFPAQGFEPSTFWATCSSSLVHHLLRSFWVTTQLAASTLGHLLYPTIVFSKSTQLTFSLITETQVIFLMSTLRFREIWTCRGYPTEKNAPYARTQTVVTLRDTSAVKPDQCCHLLTNQEDVSSKVLWVLLR